MESESQTGSNKTVLVVEDNQMIMELICMKLTERNFTPQIATTGDTAVEQALKHKPSLIILDLMLPGKSGEDVLKELRNNEITKETPVFIFTNKVKDGNVDKLQNLGTEHYLVKANTSLDSLISEIEAHAK